MEDRTIWRAIQFRLGRLYFHDVGGSLIGFCCNEKVQTTRLLPRNALLDSRYFVAMFFFCQTTFFFFLFVLISLFYRIGIIFTFAFVNLFEKNLDRKKRKKKKRQSSIAVAFTRSLFFWIVVAAHACPAAMACHH